MNQNLSSSPSSQLEPVAAKPAFKLPAWVVTTLYGVASLSVILAVWYAVRAAVGTDLPTPQATAATLWELVKDPFHYGGPNDQGIGRLLFSSLVRVALGWTLGAMVAIPLGVLMGSVPVVQRLMNPIVQVLRPVSPLAWYPIALVTLKVTPNALVFVIFITSLWPTVINTAFGVGSLPKDYKNVARVFSFSPDRYVRQVLLPFALPHILTGLRVSFGIAWMVIVAAEMLSGASGIGFFVWDSYNALSYEKVISAIVLIGVTGLVIDALFAMAQKKVTYVA
jgi:nitrate/nitrite transport system permease protein